MEVPRLIHKIGQWARINSANMYSCYSVATEFKTYLITSTHGPLNREVERPNARGYISLEVFGQLNIIPAPYKIVMTRLSSRLSMQISALFSC